MEKDGNNSVHGRSCTVPAPLLAISMFLCFPVEYSCFMYVKKTSVNLRQHGGKSSCVVAGEWGSKEEICLFFLFPILIHVDLLFSEPVPFAGGTFE